MTGQVETEASIIQGYFAPLAAGYPGAFGLRDDAAAISPPPGHDLVVTVDAIAEGVHFFPDDAPADLGWKALAINVSDLAAKGAQPHAYVMSIAFPEAPGRDWLAGFAGGLGQAQSAFGMHLIGGDTDRRPGPLSVTITAFGLVPVGTTVRRGTARPGDRVFVSGTLGCSALGLKLRSKDAAAMSWGLSEAQEGFLLTRYLRPQPRIALAQALRTHASAAMDISDGLMKDLGRMAQASANGAIIHADRLPLSAAGAMVPDSENRLISIVSGGDDYEILATVAPANADAFQAAARSVGIAVTDIGEIVEGSTVSLLDKDRHPVRIGTPGYDHF
jgi:thiamine-monophosphate kinase